MLTLSLEQAQELIASVIEEHGADKVYERGSALSGCANVHEDENGNLTPGCIVGTAFIKWGVTPQQILDVGGRYQSAWNLSDALKDASILKVDDDAQSYLMKVQGQQDGGETWGRSNEFALGQMRGESDE